MFCVMVCALAKWSLIHLSDTFYRARQHLITDPSLELVHECDSTLSQTTNFRLFQTERVCRRQFQFDENSGKFFKRLENTVGKGEIAGYKQLLLSHSVFKRLVLETRKNQGFFGKG